MGPICCPETSVLNYHSTLRKFPKRAQISFTPRQNPDVTLLQLLKYVARGHHAEISVANQKDVISGFRREVSENCALLWVITQRVVVISYRRFGTAYRSHPQGSRIKIS
jgi:hypothetical protein